MFMRRACVVSLLLVSCFDGGKATGLPCNEDAECGNEKCIDGFCGGPATTGGSTTPSTSESESMTTDITGTDTIPPTTSETDPSTTMTSGTDTTADTTAEESDSDDSMTGDPVPCSEPPPDPAICAPGGRMIAAPVPSSDAITGPLGRVFSVVAGDFLGDAQLDLAVVAEDNATHLIENEQGSEWSVNVDQDWVFNPDEMMLVDPYDFAVGDFACDGGTVFVFGGQGERLIYVGYNRDSGFNDKFESVVVPGYSYSLTAGDFLADDVGYADIVLSGNQHVTLMRNTNGFSASESELQSVIPANADYAEPWDTLVIGSGDDARVLVPAGNDLDQNPEDEFLQSIYAFRIDLDAVGGPFALEPAMPTTFGAEQFVNPWALASGDFDGDDVLDIAVGERRVQSPMEATSLEGRIRFFSFPGDLDEPVANGEVFTTGVGLNSLAAADMNCDGYMDLVIGMSGAGDPATGAPPEILFGAEQLDGLTTVLAPGVDDLGASSRIAIADFDADGRPEAAIGDFGVDGVGDRVAIVDVN